MKILFLCHANMCRSPIAEGLLKHILKQNGIPAEVDSAGFEVYHINDSPDKRAIKVAHEKGFDISSKKVRLFSKNDYDQFDKIYVMDTLAYRNAIYFARDDKDKQKVDYLMNVLHPGKNEAVSDPFLKSLDECNETIDKLQQACSMIANELITIQSHNEQVKTA
jgi:protein-tyrosine phosphatase